MYINIRYEVKTRKMYRKILKYYKKIHVERNTKVKVHKIIVRAVLCVGL